MKVNWLSKNTFLRFPKKYWVSLLALSLCGCSFTFDEQKKVMPVKETKSTLLADLSIKPITVTPTKLKPLELSEIRNGYAQLVDKLDDKGLSRHLDFRLADVEMLLAEEKQSTGDTFSDTTWYEAAIQAYEKVLASYPDDPTKEAMMYQLSRAYDLNAQGEKSVETLRALLTIFPESIHAPEAWFRLGEVFYSEGNYSEAAVVYNRVIEYGKDNPFYVMSSYMQGWAYYNVEDYDAALVAFDNMLSASFLYLELEEIEQEQSVNLTLLSKGQQRLVKDSLRLMASLFSYRGNGKAVVAFYESKSAAPYRHLVFDELAQQHLDNDRFIDASEAYLAFASAYPMHREAVSFYVKHIDAFILGDFPSEVLDAKAGFVAAFGKEQGVFDELCHQCKENAKPYLYDYLQELAQTEHSLAQRLTAPNRRTSLPEILQGYDDASLNEQANLAFDKAARFYTEFINTFPDDKLRPQVEFNLAESYFESKQYDKAIFHYERFAYDFPTHPMAGDGAYTALLSYINLLASHNEKSNDERHALLERQRKSQLRFIDTFEGDPRAVKVTQTVMQAYFEEGDFEHALKFSEWLLSPPETQHKAVALSIQHSAELVEAHALFGLARFKSAEQAYANILSRMATQDTNVKALTRNYAISIYKQAEQAVGQGDLASAIEHLNRIIDKTPDVDVRVNAQYDAANYLIAASRFDEAQALLDDFAIRFAGHELAKTIDEKRLYVYEETEQWQAAADILKAVWQENKQSQTGQEALYQSAVYYENAGNRSASLSAYRTYAHTYPEPFDLATEARFTLSEFYSQSKESNKRRYWLDKLIKSHDDAGERATLRSRTLAAMAAMVFADDAKYVFEQQKLTQPLKQSLTKKRRALVKAVDAHNKVLAYGVRDYVTIANHQLGGLYRRLARDLMASERPAELNSLELEQYDLLLEEQAYPFEEQAIQVYEINIKRSWDGVFDKWVKESFSELAELYPNRYRKNEIREEISIEHF